MSDAAGNVYIAGTTTGAFVEESLDAAGNVYIAGTLEGQTSTGYCGAFNGDTGGTPLQWESGGGRATAPYAVSTDATGKVYAAVNVYIAGAHSDDESLDAAGNGHIAGTTGAFEGESVDAAGNVYITGTHLDEESLDAADNVHIAGYTCELDGQASAGCEDVFMMTGPSAYSQRMVALAGRVVMPILA